MRIQETADGSHQPMQTRLPRISHQSVGSVAAPRSLKLADMLQQHQGSRWFRTFVRKCRKNGSVLPRLTSRPMRLKPSTRDEKEAAHSRIGTRAKFYRRGRRSAVNAASVGDLCGHGMTARIARAKRTGPGGSPCCTPQAPEITWDVMLSEPVNRVLSFP